MNVVRRVGWGNLHNVRDLGGLPGTSGSTRFGQVFRSPRLDGLDADGWRQLRASGVETIIDLRNDDEVRELPHRPAELISLRRPVEDQTDVHFMAEWGRRLGSPAYYQEALRRWPNLFARVFTAIADAENTGAVLVHCSAGRDRTGLISAMLLALVDVDLDAILDDYEVGVRETNAHLIRMRASHEDPLDETRLEEHVTRAREDLRRLLELTDVATYLLSAGVTPAQLASVRSRLLG